MPSNVPCVQISQSVVVVIIIYSDAASALCLGVCWSGNTVMKLSSLNGGQGSADKGGGARGTPEANLCVSTVTGVALHLPGRVARHSTFVH